MNARPLLPFAVYAGMLSAAGLPIYIYAPKFYADTYGVSLGALGGVLLALRLVDVVQDPLLGWCADHTGGRRRVPALLGAGLMAVAMLSLFAVPPLIDPIWWFCGSLALLFSAYSFLTILFYAQGIGTADDLGGAHLRVARWRESGALVGVCAASVAPVLLQPFGSPFLLFALGFAALAVVASLLFLRQWSAPSPTGRQGVSVREILSDGPARALLLLAIVNAAPLAVSSTLFLFYVESSLQAPGWEGPLLLLFFLSGAMAAPVWTTLAERFSVRPVLASAMVLALVSFAATFALGPGDVMWFAVICVLSGACIGADLSLLPALFAARLARIAPNGGQGFGLWSFSNKLTLAFAAALLLPLLEMRGFVAGADSPASAIETLALLYGGVPCALKLVAIACLAATPLKEI